MILRYQAGRRGQRTPYYEVARERAVRAGVDVYAVLHSRTVPMPLPSRFNLIQRWSVGIVHHDYVTRKGVLVRGQCAGLPTVCVNHARLQVDVHPAERAA